MQTADAWYPSVGTVCSFLDALTRVYRHRGYTGTTCQCGLSLCVLVAAEYRPGCSLSLYSANLISPISTALRRPHDAIYTEQSLLRRVYQGNISGGRARRFRGSPDQSNSPRAAPVNEDKRRHNPFVFFFFYISVLNLTRRR